MTTISTPLLSGIIAYGLLFSPTAANDSHTAESPTPPGIHKTVFDDETPNFTATRRIPTENDEDAGKLRPAPTVRELTPEAKNRQTRIARCLAIYHTRRVNADFLRPWSIMHGLIAFGNETLITSRGKTLNAIDYLCDNGIGDDRRLLAESDGKLVTRVGPGVQGHEAQFLAMLAQSNVPIEHSIRIGDAKFTIKDLVEYEKRHCRSSSELTFKLIGLAHYVDSEEVWKNESGQKWNISRLVHEELAQPVNEGACGGSHRLMALSYAVRKRHEAGKPIEGTWLRARNFVRSYQKHALKLQNSDGSFSTSWFFGPGHADDKKLQLYSSGHILEWLAYSLSPEQLDDPKIAKAVDFVVDSLMGATNYALDVGPRGHALHALRMYEIRMYGFASDLSNLSDDDIAVIEKLPEVKRAPMPKKTAETNSTRSKKQSPPRRRGRRLFGRR